MTETEIDNILKKHAAWLRGEDGGERADLTGANLTRAYLAYANLTGANLTCANLTYANLTGANLTGANLTCAYLTYANLTCANLAYANLTCAYLAYANLTGANLTNASLARVNLRGASLTDADLTGANLTGANLPHFQICPEQGAFIASKKLRGGKIARLLIPEDAQRTSSLVGRKCRTSKAIVLSLSNGEVGYSIHDGTEYRVGATVEPDSYDPDIRIECTHGIHFFITEREAQEY